MKSKNNIPILTNQESYSDKKINKLIFGLYKINRERFNSQREHQHCDYYFKKCLNNVSN